MRIGVLLALALIFVLPVCAQIDNGNITGRITDPSGAAIVGAQVTVTQTEMNFETLATTNEEGLYRAPNLRPGPYKITVLAQGFKKLVREGIALRGGQTLQVSSQLEVGAVAESVEVSASAQLLETETSSTGAQLQGDYFYSLPNYQKHAIAVLLFTPGVTFGSNQFTKQLGGMTINGVGSGGMAYMEDGAVATMGGRGDNAETLANSIEDIKVFTSAMPAEYGHSAGVGISVVKKAGTNAFHGTLTDQIRTRSMQHRRFFEQYRNSQTQPGFSINPPGLLVQNPDASLNGPVYIPKIYDGRNKTFFFYGFQMMIEKQGKQLTATVPTPAMLDGDFTFAGSGITPNQIYDPITTRQVNGQWFRDAFAGNIIPKNRWSNVAKTFLGYKPIAAPNVPGSWSGTGPSNNVQMGPQKITKWQNHTARIDHQFNPMLKAFFSYTYNHEWGRQPPLAIVDPRFDSSLNLGILDRHTGSMGSTWIVTPTTVNDFRFSYFARYNNTNSFARDANYASLIGAGDLGLPKTCMPGLISLGMSDQAPGGAAGGVLSPGCGSKTIQETFTVKDDLSKTIGTHSLKMGYEMLRYRLNSSSPGNVDGSFTYSGVGGLQPNGNGIANTGNIALASFMVGGINSFNFNYNMNNDLTRSWQHSMYIQDDWKVTPNLTVNLGLRYNIEPPKKQKYGYISLFDLTIPDNSVYTNTAFQTFCPPGGCLGAYKHPMGAAPFRTDYGRLDPVVGLAWHFTPKTVLRAGARISHLDTYTDNTSLLFSDEMLQQAYSQSQVSSNYRPLFMLSGGAAGTNPDIPVGMPAWSYPALRADGSVPYVTTNPGGRSPRIVPDDFKTPYVATWNVGLQRELSKDYILELRWEGSAQVKAYGSYDINAVQRGIIRCAPGENCVTRNLEDPANFNYRYQWSTNTISSYQTQWARPFPNLGSINWVCNCGHTSHNAGIIRIEKRFSKGLNFQGYYTYSKTLTGNAGNIYQDWGLNKARSGQDQTHNFTATMNYEVPVGKGRKFLGSTNRVVDALLGGYNVMWTYTIASGRPIGMSLSGISVPENTVGGTRTTMVGVPQYPGYMPGFGSLLLLRRPTLRDNWQDLGTNRFDQKSQNSMIDCGTAIANGSPMAGNECFTYVRPYSYGNNGSNVWDSQRIIAANAAISKEVKLKGEQTRLQVRLDWQNPLKWFNWGGPSTGLNVQNQAQIDSNNTFGKINPGNNGETATGTAGYGGTPLLNLTLALKW